VARRALPAIWLGGAAAHPVTVPEPDDAPCRSGGFDLLCIHTRGRAIGSVNGILAHTEETTMAWTTPILVEICIGLEINGYLPAEF